MHSKTSEYIQCARWAVVYVVPGAGFWQLYQGRGLKRRWCAGNSQRACSNASTVAFLCRAGFSAVSRHWANASGYRCAISCIV